MRRIFLWFALALAFSPAALAQSTAPAMQTESHSGDFFFQLPSGWKQHQDKNSIYLLAPAQQPGTATDIVLMSYPLEINLRVTFERIWEAFQKTYRVVQSGQLQTINRNGERAVMMASTVQDSRGQRFAVEELLIRNGERAESVLYISSDSQNAGANEQALTAFLATLHFAEAAPQMPMAPAANSAYGGAANSGATGTYASRPQMLATNSPAAPGQLAGIYRAMAPAGTDPTTGLQSWDPATKTPNYSFLVFFPDGRVRKGLPTQGLGTYVDESAMRLDVASGGAIAAKWGTYQMSGAQGRITFVTRETWPIVAYPDRLEINGSPYFRMEGGAGVQLLGTYKPFGDANAKGIMFTVDGEFDDEGILHSNTAMAIGMSGGGVTMGYGFGSPGPGRGSYQVSNFGITLHYATGQNPTALFYAEPGVGGNGAPQQIFINNVKFVRVQ